MLRLALDGKGRYQVRTGIRFLDHMLELFARHGAFDLRVQADGDLDVDQHHTVEDLGIALGEAVSRALGDRRGINRAGYFVMPMDETLAVAAIDLGGRAHAVVDMRVNATRVGDLQAELVHDFFEGFATGALDGRRRLVGRRRRAIDARHARALGGEADRRRASDPRAGTGDQRERPTHPSHWHHPEIHARNRRLDPAGSRIQSLVPGTPGGRGEASP